MSEAINRLKAMLQWSDRIGSDEIVEIREIIKMLEKEIEMLEKEEKCLHPVKDN